MKRAPGKDWVSEGTWRLIAKRTALLRSGKIRQIAARRMKREVYTALKEDKRRLTVEVGENIVSELGKGNVQEAFRHLKGWYRTASEAQARPCPMADAGARQEFERSTLRHGFAGQRRKRTLRMGQLTLAPGNCGVSLSRSAPPFG